MVHDPRVTQQLSRLGGLYRDPSRVDRDASSLCKSSVGSHLQPIASEMVENNGNVAIALVLQGTFQIHFRGNEYQLLTDIYLPAGYPVRPPVAFIRLAEHMYLKENHRHVGADGKVYLPYLHEWNQSSHNLVELVVAMASVFSDDPPVFTKAPTAAETAAAASSSASASASPSARPVSQPPPPSFSQSLDHDIPPPSWESTTRTTATRSRTRSPEPSFSRSGSGVPSWQRDAEAILAAEAAEANAAADAARQAERERLSAEREQAAAMQAVKDQEAYERAKRTSVRDQVNRKIHQTVTDKTVETQQIVQQDWRDQQRLTLAETDKVLVQLAFLKKHQAKLLALNETVDQKQEALQEWLEEAAVQKTNEDENGSNGTASTVTSVDDTVQPQNALHGQMLDLAAENAAISDTLYFLDRGLYKGHVNCEVHLKQVRRLAKRQFLVRAHLIKIHQAIMVS
jgi:ubiquitin-protein ligase